MMGRLEVGEEFLGFRLIDELGRGAFSKVFLARQENLADRPVVLKVSQRPDDEPKVLAQLQHTNIVPVYSIHQLGGLRAVCMPYFGSTTLNDVYEDLTSRASLAGSGLELIGTVSRRRAARTSQGTLRTEAPSDGQPGEDAAAPAAAATGPPLPESSAETWKYLAGLTYVEAVLWMAARLASGLAHAHQRGILHLDIKPGNILLTDDGQPMLLDFNLSVDLKARAGPGAAAGGTVLYMSPEQLEHFRGDDRRLDGRCDLYAMGVILYELLTGRHPFPIPAGPSEEIVDPLLESRKRPPPGVRCWNQAVSPAVESMIRHCLEPDPARRYQSARELQEDLERHLRHEPLKYAAEPSLRERVSKWMLRHPAASSTTSITLLAVAVIAMIGSASWLALRDSRIARARLHFIEFHQAFENCQLLLNTTHNGPPDYLLQGTRLARRALEPYLKGGPGAWASLPLVRDLPAAERTALESAVTELIILEVRAGVTLAERGGSAAEHRTAYRWGLDRLEQVRRIDSQPPAAFHQDRARLLAALGQEPAAARERALASATPLRTARDEYLLGTSLLAEGHPDRAEVFLSRATARDPRGYWSWFALGICHSDQGRPADAAFDFGACTILAPQFAWPHLNRGLALARCGRLTEALASYDRALELNPNFVEAWVDRGLAQLELGNPEPARQDLERALALGQRSPAVLAAHAEALARLGRHEDAERAFAAVLGEHPKDPFLLSARGFARLGRDPAGAAADFDRALQLDPRHPRAHLGRAYLVRGQDPRAALEHVQRALDAEPDFGDALQLRALLRARLNDPNAETDVDRFLRVTTPQRLYNAACTFALLTRARTDARLTARALDSLQRALEAGLSPDYAEQDPDLAPLRRSPRFTRLIAAARQARH
ncbi:MAG TPA: tetratricopeptide repeat protein [Isosphaeraceae bacterium]|nr:tetratricopeptide repeat protein [Isosphaeraceae bacterium]